MLSWRRISGRLFDIHAGNFAGSDSGVALAAAAPAGLADWFDVEA
jgi:hypothetical protein